MLRLHCPVPLRPVLPRVGRGGGGPGGGRTRICPSVAGEAPRIGRRAGAGRRRERPQRLVLPGERVRLSVHAQGAPPDPRRLSQVSHRPAKRAAAALSLGVILAATTVTLTVGAVVK